jgi:hypothetical protein
MRNYVERLRALNNVISSEVLEVGVAVGQLFLPSLNILSTSMLLHLLCRTLQTRGGNMFSSTEIIFLIPSNDARRN